MATGTSACSLALRGFIPCMPLSCTGDVVRGGPFHGAKIRV